MINQDVSKIFSEEKITSDKTYVKSHIILKEIKNLYKKLVEKSTKNKMIELEPIKLSSDNYVKIISKLILEINEPAKSKRINFKTSVSKKISTKKLKFFKNVF